MTVLCGGGTSAPIASVPSTELWGISALANLLTDGGWSWIQEALALVGAVNLDLPALCATDPPPMPTFTLLEVEALLTVQPSTDFESGLSKLRDLISHLAWFQLCQCTSTATPALGPPTGPPSGFGVQLATANCGALASGNQSCTGSSSFITETAVLIGPILVTSSGTIVPGVQGQPLPAGCTGAVVSMNLVSANATPSNTCSFYVWWSNASGYISQNNFIHHAVGFQSTVTLSPPAGATGIGVAFQADSNDGITYTGSASVVFLCGTGANTPAQPCCPPDSVAAGILNQVWSLVQLIQRQAVPFAYLHSTAHVGLTGSGQIAVSDLIGAKVLINVPVWAGVEPGNPNTVFADAWINWGNADGWTAREFIRSAAYVSLPPLAGQFTLLGYSLPVGVSADITELVREA